MTCENTSYYLPLRKKIGWEYILYHGLFCFFGLLINKRTKDWVFLLCVVLLIPLIFAAFSLSRHALAHRIRNWCSQFTVLRFQQSIELLKELRGFGRFVRARRHRFGLLFFFWHFSVRNTKKRLKKNSFLAG